MMKTAILIVTGLVALAAAQDTCDPRFGFTSVLTPPTFPPKEAVTWTPSIVNGNTVQVVTEFPVPEGCAAVQAWSLDGDVAARAISDDPAAYLAAPGLGDHYQHVLGRQAAMRDPATPGFSADIVASLSGAETLSGCTDSLTSSGLTTDAMLSSPSAVELGDGVVSVQAQFVLAIVCYADPSDYSWGTLSTTYDMNMTLTVDTEQDSELALSFFRVREILDNAIEDEYYMKVVQVVAPDDVTSIENCAAGNPTAFAIDVQLETVSSDEWLVVIRSVLPENAFYGSIPVVCDIVHDGQSFVDEFFLPLFADAGLVDAGFLTPGFNMDTSLWLLDESNFYNTPLIRPLGQEEDVLLLLELAGSNEDWGDALRIVDVSITNDAAKTIPLSFLYSNAGMALANSDGVAALHPEAESLSVGVTLESTALTYIGGSITFTLTVELVDSDGGRRLMTVSSTHSVASLARALSLAAARVAGEDAALAERVQSRALAAEARQEFSVRAMIGQDVALNEDAVFDEGVTAETIATAVATLSGKPVVNGESEASNTALAVAIGGGAGGGALMAAVALVLRLRKKSGAVRRAKEGATEVENPAVGV